jgi:hypothetical protein
MESVGKCYGPLVCFAVIWYILRSFGIFWVRLVYFARFGVLFKDKSGNTGSKPNLSFVQDVKNVSITERPSVGQAALEL